MGDGREKYLKVHNFEPLHCDTSLNVCNIAALLTQTHNENEHDIGGPQTRSAYVPGCSVAD